MKKIISILLVLSLLVGLAACQSSPQSSGTTDTSQNDATTETSENDSGDTAENPYYHKYDPPITITVNGVTTSPNDVYPEGEDATNNNYTRWAEENLGIKFVPKWISANGDMEKQKLSMAMASNDLPDFIQAPRDMAAKLMKAGAVLELDPLLEEYASPLTEAILEDFDSALDNKAFTVSTYDGKRYGLVDWADPWAVDCRAIWLRKDVLEKANMQPPKTVEDFEKYLAAAKEQNPEFFGPITDKDLSGLQMVAFDPFGAVPNQWIEKDGALAYGGIQPEVKEGLTLLNSWYEKGYLDKEFVAKDWSKSMDSLSAATAVAVEGAWWMGYDMLPKSYKTDPEASFTTVPYLEGPDGYKQIGLKPAIGSNARMINKNCKYPEAAIYQLNDHLDSSLRDNKELREKLEKEAGYTFRYPITENMGEIIGGYPKPDNYDEIKDENGNYDYTKGKWSYEMEGPRFTYNTMTNPTQLGMRGFFILECAYQLRDGFLGCEDAYKNDGYDELSNEYKNYYDTVTGLSDHNESQIEAFYGMIEGYNQAVSDGYVVYDKNLSAPTPTQVEKGAYLTKLQNETFAKIIMGEQPVDSFDQFVNEWKQAGGDQVTQEINDWYAANK